LLPFIVSMALAGCGYSSQGESKSVTSHRLDVIVRAIDMFPQQDILKFESIQAFCDEAQRHGFILGATLYKKDYWGNEFVWKTSQAPDGIIVTIGSSGPNRKWEDGGGDDIWIQIKLVPNHKAQLIKKQTP
jgi:hypothetical protein